jgi:hypothetical protein
MIRNNIKRGMDELDIALNNILEEGIDDYNLQKHINKAFSKKDLNLKMVKCLFGKTKVISDMNDIEKMTFADACFKYLKDEHYDIKKYYSDIKIAEWSNYISVNERNDEIFCEDFRRVNSYEYYGTFTYEQVYKNMKDLLWLYYPSTQRSAKYTEKSSGNIIREVNVNKKSVVEIANLILEGKFETTEIILNCMLFKGKTPQFKFEKRYKEIGDITIKPNYDTENPQYTLCTILDGYHRVLGICKAVEMHYEKTGQWLDGRISCKLVLADITRAKRIVELVFKRTDDDKNWLKSLEQSDYTEFVEMIISDSKILKGNVADIYEQCKFNDKLTYKVVLTDTIKKLKIDVANKSVSLFAASEMANIIDTLFDIINQSETSLKRFYKIPNMFIGYLTLAYMLKDKELAVSDYIKTIKVMQENINEYMVKSLKLDTKGCSVNKVISCFEKIAKEVK